MLRLLCTVTFNKLETDISSKLSTFTLKSYNQAVSRPLHVKLKWFYLLLDSIALKTLSLSLLNSGHQIFFFQVHD